jgi:hypothetical protein
MSFPGALAALTVLITLGAARPGIGQELTGVALGPDGQPLERTPVALHRVGQGAGAFIATDTTDADGAFGFELEADSAVYFAAARFEGRMYIGPAVQAGTAVVRDYVLQIDPANEAGAVASAIGPRQPPARPATPPGQGAPGGSSDEGALLLVGLLALGAAGAFFFAAPRYRQRQTRDSLIELAAVENALADGPDADERPRLEADRDRLRDRLAPRP